MKITILNENTAIKRGILAEHGLSILIEAEKKRYLFDTGQSDVFIRNAGKLGVKLHDLDGIILSHGHFDHCGGLEYLLKDGNLPIIYVRQGAFLEKTAINSDKVTYRKIGIPWKRDLIHELNTVSEDMTEIAKDVYLLGNIPYGVEFEPWGGIFFIDRGDRKVPDFMTDEQMMVMDTDKGLSVFLGCSHAGIVNCLTYVKTCFPGKKLYSVLAGMHLIQCSEDRLEQTIKALRDMDIEQLIPVHCTGIEAIGKMKLEFGSKCRIVEAGSILEL